MSMTSKMTTERRPALRSRSRAARAAAIGSVPHAWYRSAGGSSRARVCHQPRTVCGQKIQATGPLRRRAQEPARGSEARPGAAVGPAGAAGPFRGTRPKPANMPLGG